MIKVSIIIPAYNVEQYIQRCIESASNQTLQEIEIIVVNDGATDSTPSIIAKCAEKDPRIVVINKKNGGLSSARNAGLDIVKGEYIQHLDGDDWIEKEACEVLYKYACQHDLDMLVCDYYSDDDHGGIIRQHNLNDGIYSGDEYIYAYFEGVAAPAIWTKLIKNEIHKGIQNENEISYGEDALLTIKLALKSAKIGKLNKAFLHYIRNPHSITNSVLTISQFKQILLVCDYIRGAIKQENKESLFSLGMERDKSSAAGSFLLLPPKWNNKEYRLLESDFLSYLKGKPDFSKTSHILVRLTLNFLIKFPFLWTIKAAVITLYLARKLKRLLK